jgi:hypothetical protein
MNESLRTPGCASRLGCSEVEVARAEAELFDDGPDAPTSPEEVGMAAGLHPLITRILRQRDLIQAMTNTSRRYRYA